MLYKNKYKEVVALIKFYIGGPAPLEVQNHRFLLTHKRVRPRAGFTPLEVQNLRFFLTRKRVRPLTGFTLIETLLAVLVMMVAIAGPLTIASKGLSTALVAKDRTIALFLAQDAVEYVRFARDTNRLGNKDWLKGDLTAGASLTNLTPCMSADGTATCYFDSTGQNPAVVTSCAASNCSAFPMYFDSTSGRYTYDTGATKTIFIRTVSITTPPSPGVSNTSDAVIKVEVSWKDTGNFSRSVILVDNLLDWQ